MSKSEYIKFSGWAFVAGSFAFLTILSNSDAIQFGLWHLADLQLHCSA